VPQKPNSEKIKMEKTKIRRENINFIYHIPAVVFGSRATIEEMSKGQVTLKMVYEGEIMNSNQKHADSRIIKMLVEETGYNKPLEIEGEPQIGRLSKDDTKIYTILRVKVPSSYEFEDFINTSFKKV